MTASLLNRASANSCVVNQNALYTYTITTDTSIPDISGVCGGLWDNLNGFSACSASATSCGAYGSGNVLRWEFTVPDICNSGDVQAAWWDATTNQWGAISC
jgi:hypothetical protein